MKIAISSDWGGFWLSKEAVEWICEKKGVPYNHRTSYHDMRYLERNDPDLIECIETLGEKAGTGLKIVEIPDDVDWILCDYDGKEWVAEKHRTWE